MGKFLEFVRTAGRIGGSSVLLAVISLGITAFEHWQSHNVAASVFGTLGILFFCYGSFVAWGQEREKRIAFEAKYLDQRPRLLLIVDTSRSGVEFRDLRYSGQTTVFFSIQHLSGRSATEINIDPIQSEVQDFQLRLAALPYLMPATSRNLDFEVWQDQVVPAPELLQHIGWDCLLPVFFNTGYTNVRMHYYDVRVRYKDRDTELTQNYRFGFDVKEQQLLPATEVSF